MIKNDKCRNIGALADTAHANFVKNFSLHAFVIAIISSIFIFTMVLLIFTGLGIILPSIPNFARNAIAAQGIFLGAFFAFLTLIVSFFLAWQNSCSIIVCNNYNSSKNKIIKSALKTWFAALSVQLAGFVVLMPFALVIALVIIVNPTLITSSPYISLAVIVLLLILLRTFSFFSLTISSQEKKFFFTAILSSAKLVIRKGFIKILFLVLFISAINIGMFGGLLYLLLALINQIPENITDVVLIITNPTWASAALALAYIPTAFISPRLDILAQYIYKKPVDCTSGGFNLALNSNPNPTPNNEINASLPSRTLATCFDIFLCAIVYILSFTFLLNIISNGQYGINDMNFIAYVTVILAFFAVFIIYNVYCEVFGNGQTLGKKLFGLIVLNNHGFTPSLLQSIIRNVLRIVDVFTVIIAIFSKEHHRLGDMLSLTTVEHCPED